MDFDDFDNGSDDDFEMEDSNDDEGYYNDGFKVDDNSVDDSSEVKNDTSDDEFGWEDIGMLGGMAEEFAEEEKERLRMKKEFEKDKNI